MIVYDNYASYFKFDWCWQICRTGAADQLIAVLLFKGTAYDILLIPFIFIFLYLLAHLKMYSKISFQYYNIDKECIEILLAKTEMV